MKNVSALSVFYNLIIYKKYLLDNNLADDSKSISVKRLMTFVKDYIDEDERREMIKEMNLSTIL